MAKMKPANRGFSLVEIMVALVIGMIGVLVIMQVARTSEAQKRMTTGSGDAQNNGALAIYSIQRDIKQGGYGFNAHELLRGCSLDASEANTVAAIELPDLKPITINPPAEWNLLPSGDTGADTLLIVYGSSAGAPEGDTVVDDTYSNSDCYGIGSVGHFKDGDWAVAAPSSDSGTCELVMSEASLIKPGNICPNANPDMDTTSTEVRNWVIVPAADGHKAVINDLLFNFGSELKIIGYAIRDGQLTTCDYLAKPFIDCRERGNWLVVADGIVSLKAIAASSATTGVSAIQLALAVRNGEWNKDPVTTTAPTWSGGEIDLSTLENWQNYRYQIYETVVPLRNIPWMEKP
ncbi:MAG: prepilin-type N-terminal cleavage/methylation domain-containing protein [Candidatus Accumulibacter sp.]|nr:prepilin-type N-terminal cleavage/methylation domain-containing protein [Accumulibacter sp.]